MTESIIQITGTIVTFLGAVALVLGVAWLALVALFYLINVIYEKTGAATEFLHWAIARRVIRRRKKEWIRFGPDGKPDPNGDFTGPNRKWNRKALGPHPEEEKASEEWRLRILSRMGAAEKVCSSFSVWSACDCEEIYCEHFDAVTTNLDAQRSAIGLPVEDYGD
ncbi:MAG: hypothetical protein K2W95_15830 [Candidatus Obscuribacterales bacterium]|nr:hypothetical protein [Candidatus Obscuribacterales bacterium]